MTDYILFGKYSPDSIKLVSSERTKKGYDLVKKAGGNIKSMYALLGEKDLVMIAEFPDNEKAMQASIDLFKLTGISFSAHPAIPVEKFDKIAK
ncbi:MAG: GYD domain-containing protein [Ignavibacteria bacterium]|nr:GYD domain-containing protein [Ignavibacteriaceae bacterium]